MALKSTSQKKLRKMRSQYHADSWEEYEEIEKKIYKELLRYFEPTITGQVRVTAGKAKNIMLDIPKKTRPLTDRMKTQIFDVLQKDIAGLTILDMYAGSGSFGLEALSRGAKSVVFVDAAKHAEKILESNIRKTGFLTESTVVKEKAADYLYMAVKEQMIYELIFIDPPYKLFNKKFKERLNLILSYATQLLPVVRDPETKLFKGVIILKHPRIYPIELISTQGLKLVETYTYGMNAISIYIVDLKNPPQLSDLPPAK